MDWLTSGLAEAKRTAQEAALRARELAQQASQQAKVLAEQASVQAKVLAERAQEEATAVQNKFNQMSGSGPRSASCSPEELLRLGVDERLLEFVSSLTYSMFSDVKSEMSKSEGAAAFGSLSPWQERHALVVLSKAPNLQGLRFALSPRHMTDNEFWSIYFKLAHNVLPSELEREEAVSPQPTDTSMRATGASSTSDSVSAGLKSTVSMFGTLLRNTQTLLTPEQPVDSATGARAQRETGLAAAAQPATPVHSAPGSLLGRSDAAAADRQGEEASTPGSATGVRAADAEDEAASGDDECGSEAMEDLEDDPELAAYLQEALAVEDDDGDDEGDGAGGDELSDLGSAAEDLDDYITMLDAELAAGSPVQHTIPQTSKPL